MIRQFIGLVILSAILAVAGTTQAAGGRSGIVTPAAPVITSTSIDNDRRLLTIKGRSFGSDTPSVVLGDMALRVQQNTENQILVELPAGMKKATYRLTVGAGSASRVDSDPFFTTLLADIQ